MLGAAAPLDFQRKVAVARGDKVLPVFQIPARQFDSATDATQADVQDLHRTAVQASGHEHRPASISSTFVILNVNDFSHEPQPQLTKQNTDTPLTIMKM